MGAETDKPLPQARTEAEKKVVADLQQHGWHVIKVLPEGGTPLKLNVGRP